MYHWSEVEAFAQVFYKPPERQSAGGPRAHAASPPAGGGPIQGDRATRRSARSSARSSRGYVKVYAFLSQIVPYADPDLEMLYSYGRFLLPHLPLDRDTSVVKVGDEVALQYYRLERVFSGRDHGAGKARPQCVKSPTEVGTGKAKDEKAPLSEIIEVLNERFGTQFTEEDRLFFQQIKEKACKTSRSFRLRWPTRSTSSSWASAS